jgi:hypothetical protein
MSHNRCFDLLQHTISNSSDYTRAKKQKTMYAELAKNSSTTAIGPNPVKKNGFRYNMNFGITEPNKCNSLASPGDQPDCSGGCLKFARSYELLLDVTKGKLFGNPMLNEANSHEGEMWAGNVITVSYGDYPVVDTSYGGGNFNKVLFPFDTCAIDCCYNYGRYPGMVVDPSNIIFNHPCAAGTKYATHGVPPWVPNTVTLTNLTKSSNYYWKVINAQPLHGMRYPGPVNFSYQRSNMRGPSAPRPAVDVSYRFGVEVSNVPVCQIPSGNGRQKSAIN